MTDHDKTREALTAEVKRLAEDMADAACGADAGYFVERERKLLHAAIDALATAQQPAPVQTTAGLIDAIVTELEPLAALKGQSWKLASERLSAIFACALAPTLHAISSAPEQPSAAVEATYVGDLILGGVDSAGDFEDCDNELSMRRIETLQECVVSGAPMRYDLFAVPKGTKLYTATPEPLRADVVEQIAREWDGCKYEGVGEDIDIGAAIRATAAKLGSEPLRVGALTDERIAELNREAQDRAIEREVLAGSVTSEELVERICRDVAELPDRSSPDDWPEAMLVTADELATIVREVLATQPTSAAAGREVPADSVLVPLADLEAAAQALGNFVSDHGWSDADMQAMDNLDACITQHRAATSTGEKP